MKNCTKCLEPKSLDQFYKQAASKDGLNAQCRECRTTYDRKYYADNLEKERARNRERYAANFEKIIIANRKWAVANSERVRTNQHEWYTANFERLSVGYREWTVTNPERVRANQRRWQAANREKVREIKRRWKAANPEQVQLDAHRRRAHKKENEIFLVTPKDIRRIMAQPCYLCNDAPSVHIEHIIPISRKGRHSIGNFMGACEPCNLGKHDKYIVEFRRYQRQIRLAA